MGGGGGDFFSLYDFFFMAVAFWVYYFFGGGRGGEFSSAAIFNNLETPHNLNAWDFRIQTNINFITLQTNRIKHKSSGMAVYSTWFYHVETMFIHKAFLQGFLATRIHDEIAVHKLEYVRLPYCRKMGILPGLTILPI